VSAGRVPPDPDYAARVRASFARQDFMILLGALRPAACAKPGGR
jgi:hypothetical protein